MYEFVKLLGILICAGPPLTVLLALIYAIRADHKRLPVKERGLTSGSHFRCPSCTKLLPAATRVCPYCETDLNEIVMPIRAYRPGYEGRSDVAVCIRCGRLNGPKWSECKHCGTPLERPAKKRLDSSNT